MGNYQAISTAGILMCVLWAVPAWAQIALDTSLTAETLVVQHLIGNDRVKVANVRFRGSKRALGWFEVDTADFSLGKGLLLATGQATSVCGPNQSSHFSDQLNRGGDDDLRALCKSPTYDAAVLEFDFIPLSNRISFRYVFASEEYPEFAGSAYNDVFAFFIAGPEIEHGKQNMALLPTGSVVSINSVNHLLNTDFFVNNNCWTLGDRLMSEAMLARTGANTELLRTAEPDGFTTVLTATSNVVPFQKYHLKIAIADVTDMVYNSYVFLEAGSFQVAFDTLADARFRVRSDIDVDKIDFDQIFAGKKIDTLPIIPTIAVPTVPTVTTPIIPAPIVSADPEPLPPPTTDKVWHLSPVLFAYNTTLPTAGCDTTLFRLLDLARSYQQTNVYLYGHTDAVGSPQANLLLSQHRAEAVRNFLTARGVAEHRIHCYAYGEAQPVADNLTPEGMAKNRRVEVFVR